jgi:uncharacterized protein YutD
MFSHGNLKECIDEKLFLERDSEIVKSFLYYHVILGDSNAAQLLTMADKYNVELLKS